MYVNGGGTKPELEAHLLSLLQLRPRYAKKQPSPLGPIFLGIKHVLESLEKGHQATISAPDH